jgi:hypothetical protein
MKIKAKKEMTFRKAKDCQTWVFLLSKAPPKCRVDKIYKSPIYKQIMLPGHVQVRLIARSSLERTQPLQNSHGTVEQAMG